MYVVQYTVRTFIIQSHECPIAYSVEGRLLPYCCSKVIMRLYIDTRILLDNLEITYLQQNKL
jgi:hypothetical protein